MIKHLLVTHTKCAIFGFCPVLNYSLNHPTSWGGTSCGSTHNPPPPQTMLSRLPPTPRPVKHTLAFVVPTHPHPSHPSSCSIVLRLVFNIRNRIEADRRTPEEQQRVAEAKNPIRLFACRADYHLLDPGSRPLFDEFLEMSE